MQGAKKNKLWLIADFQFDAYHRDSGEIVAFAGNNGT
jgi:hypothetical protein